MSNDEIPTDAKALVAIGSERVATLLAEVAITNPSMRRRLQFELAAQKGENVATAVRQWISEFGEQTSFLDPAQVSELSAELDAMRVTIASSVSQVLPELAPDLMWQIFTLAGSIFERTTEDGWEASCVFDQACTDLVTLSVAAKVEPAVFARKVTAAIIAEQYGEYGTLIQVIASAQQLAPAYASELKIVLEQQLNELRGPASSQNSEHGHVLWRALRGLESASVP